MVRACVRTRFGDRVIVAAGRSATVPAILSVPAGPVLQEICAIEHAHLFSVLRMPGEHRRLGQGTRRAADTFPAWDCRRTRKQD
jgi:hypothetical protein